MTFPFRHVTIAQVYLPKVKPQTFNSFSPDIGMQPDSVSPSRCEHALFDANLAATVTAGGELYCESTAPLHDYAGQQSLPNFQLAYNNYQPKVRTIHDDIKRCEMAQTDTAIIVILALIFIVLLYGLLTLLMRQWLMSKTSSTSAWGPQALGLWHESKKKRLVWSFRPDQMLTPFSYSMQTEFELPVIVLSSAENKTGPLPYQPIFYVDGTESSCRYTGTMQIEFPTEYDTSHIRTNSERASWLSMITALQAMERYSTEWESRTWRATANLNSRPDFLEMTSLVVGIQRKRHVVKRSELFRKPYATTTLSELVQLAAMLGIYWKTFDRDDDKYRAEGNGYILRGSRVPDLGLVFAFEEAGWHGFGPTRVIPTSGIQELCFGYVPTIWRSGDQTKPRRQIITEVGLQAPKTYAHEMYLQTLRLGSKSEIMRTLRYIGCDAIVIRNSVDEDCQLARLIPGRSNVFYLVTSCNVLT